MAAGLTRSICSPKLGSVEKSIREVCLLPYGGWIRSVQTKQKPQHPRTKLNPFLVPVLNCEGALAVVLRSDLPPPARED